MNTEIASRELKKGIILKLIRGDITEERVDAIVNAANSHLAHGGGVAGAIVRKGGKEIQTESDRINFVPVGKAVITGAGKLPAKFVIHAVGPRWGEGDEDNKLRNAVNESLKIASEKNLRSVSLPAISSGIFGFPKVRCARIMLSTIESFVKSQVENHLEEIRLCLFDQESVDIFNNEFKTAEKSE
jgi:O-acetyl-ADP-ribose deacetylase (regulator of RNase III)